MPFYAHSNGPDKATWQLLRDHLSRTAELAQRLSRGTPMTEFAPFAANLHDLGKYSAEFQRRLEGTAPRVDHSTAGAQWVLAQYQQTPVQKWMATLIAYCISGHHSGLLNYGSPIDIAGDGTLWARRKATVKDYRAFASDMDLSALHLPGKIPIRPMPKATGFSLAFFTRMIYSVLVDADFQDTETYFQGEALERGQYPNIAELQEKLESFLEERFGQPQQEIHRLRSATLKACQEAAALAPGLFTLTVPTGGGKTYSSLAFALRHARQHGMMRIIYVIPYTSIIDQNASVFKECLGEETVLEHHSNFELKRNALDQDEDLNVLEEKLKRAAENWDIPVIATTNVQFFESLYANRSSRCRKLHNIARSVIIFDEAQMLPREFLQPCLWAVDELVRNYGCSAVFCTATQPVVGRFLPEGEKNLRELAPDPQALVRFYKRVQVRSAGRSTDEALVSALEAQEQVLCIVNTRRHAREVFSLLGKECEGRFHLSTLMCPAHRRAVLAEVRQRLKDGRPCRVVSTQLLEAGVDVDFPVGYRALAGLDSIIQAAGRVNREGKRPGGELIVFEPDSEAVRHLPAYIEQGAAVARGILRRFQQDPISLAAIQAYFNELYDLQGEGVFDAKGILGCFNKKTTEMDFDFKTAAENFRLIEDHTQPVVIPYDDAARALLEQVRLSKRPEPFMRKLQPYTVNIYGPEYEKLLGLGKLYFYGELFAVLNNPKEDYSPETGLKLPEGSGGDAILL